MSMCDNCIHDKVCGVEDNHDESITFCADMIPKYILDKIRAEIEEERKGYPPSADEYKTINKVLQIIDKYKKESEI